MSEAPIDPRDLRVSDAERAHVVAVLQKAIGRGLLSLDDFTQRTDTALAARTRGELNGVLVDLPGLIHPESGSEPVQPAEIRATMASVKREGAWVVPADLRVYNRMSSTELDFTEAVITDPVIRVEFDVKGGSVLVLLPERASLEHRVTGSVEDKAGPGTRGSGPHFVITGAVRAGKLVVRRPTYIRIGSLTVRKPWRITWDA